MAIHESGENYLEAIFILGKKSPLVRSIDLAGFLGVTKPSVSRAVSILKTDGFLEMGLDGSLKLTEQGHKIAQTMFERHELFTEFLKKIGVDEDTAAEDACRMEHVVSEKTFAKLREFIDNVKILDGVE